MCFGFIGRCESSVAICSSTSSGMLPYSHSGVIPIAAFTQHITLLSPPHSTYRALCSISPFLTAALGPPVCLATHATNSPSTLEGMKPKQKPQQAPLLTTGLSESFVGWVKGKLSPMRSWTCSCDLSHLFLPGHTMDKGGLL